MGSSVTDSRGYVNEGRIIMQIWLPYQSYVESLHVLFDSDLRQQRIDAWNVVGILSNFYLTSHVPYAQVVLYEKYGSDPAVLLWRGYTNSLIIYHNICLATMVERDLSIKHISYIDHQGYATKPPFVGNNAFHDQHKCLLKGKNPAYSIL